MTFIATGQGTLSYRILIEGCPFEAVSTQAMTRASSVTGVSPTAVYNAARAEGIVLDGERFSIKSNPISCTLEVGGLSIKLVDVDSVWSGVFDIEPSLATVLAADMNDTDTTMSVASSDAWPIAGLLWIDGEAIYHDDVSGGSFDSLSRGQLSPDAGSAQYHYITDGERLRTPDVTNWPVLWEQRRVVIYRYDEADDPQGDGTAIYRGTISTAPSFDGEEWTIGIDNVVSVLDQKFGEDLSVSMGPRGVHYTNVGPFQMNYSQHAAASATYVQGGVTVSGFYEDNDSWCTALTAAIAASFSTSGATGTLTAVSEGADGWHLVYHTDAGTPKELSVQITMLWTSARGSIVVTTPIDPPLGALQGSPSPTIPAPIPVPVNDWGYPQLVDGTPTGSVYGSPLVADKDYFFYRPMNGFASPVETTLGQVPRGSWAYNGDTDGRTIYLAGSGTLPSNVTSVLVEGTDPGGGDYSDVYDITSVDTANRAIVISPFTPAAHSFLSDSAPTIRLGLTLQTAAAPNGSNIADVLDFVAANAAQYGPLGAMPFLRTEDFDSARWHTVFDPLPPINTARVFVTFSPVSLGDIVREELKAAGCFLAMDTAGRLIPALMRLPAASEFSALATIDVDLLFTDKARTSHEVSGLGQVNQVLYSNGFDPASGDFIGSPKVFQVRDVAAFGQSPSVRSMAIGQLSQYVGSDPIDAATVLASVSPIFGAFAGSYDIDTIDAAKSQEVEIGQAIKFDCPYLIEATSTSAAGYPVGQKGVLGRVGIVLGKEWSPFDPRIRFTVLNTKQKIAGYAPAEFLTSIVDVGGGVSWTATAVGPYLPDGSTIQDFFDVLDRIQVVRWNSASAGAIEGTITYADDSNNIEFDTDSVWAPGSDDWYITIASTATALAKQYAYAIVADAVGVIDNGGANQQRAKVFAP